MNYWQLTVRRPNIGEEIFDLRTHRTLFAGDDHRNDICIDTLKLPGRHKILVASRGNRFDLRLTDEVAASLKGNFTKKKEWKTRLYSGSHFDITGECEWQIGNAHFSLNERNSIPLTAVPTHLTELEKKHWKQSIGASFGVHAVILLLFFAFGSVYKLLQNEIKPEQMTKVSIQTAQKVFEKQPQLQADLAPAEAPVKGPAVTEVAKEETPKEEPAPLNPKPAQPTKAAAVSKGSKNKAVASKLPTPKSEVPAKPDLDSMGLLAIQSTAKPKKTNLDVAALAAGTAGSKTPVKNPRAGLGIAKGESDFGMLADAGGGSEVAKLEGSGVESYQGGLGEKVKKGSFRGASIKLVRREVEIRGGLDPAVIRQIIEERLPEVRYCYETALLQQTNLSGKISAQWTIMPDGSVGELKSESDEIKGNILHPCIREQIKRWKFPSPKGGGVVHVKYPFLFSPVGS